MLPLPVNVHCFNAVKWIMNFVHVYGENRAEIMHFLCFVSWIPVEQTIQLAVRGISREMGRNMGRVSK